MCVIEYRVGLYYIDADDKEKAARRKYLQNLKEKGGPEEKSTLDHASVNATIALDEFLGEQSRFCAPNTRRNNFTRWMSNLCLCVESTCFLLFRMTNVVITPDSALFYQDKHKITCICCAFVISYRVCICSAFKF